MTDAELARVRADAATPLTRFLNRDQIVSLAKRHRADIALLAAELERLQAIQARVHVTLYPVEPGKGRRRCAHGGMFCDVCRWADGQPLEDLLAHGKADR